MISRYKDKWFALLRAGNQPQLDFLKEATENTNVTMRALYPSLNLMRHQLRTFFMCSSLYLNLLSVPYCPILAMVCPHSLLPSVSLVISTVPQFEDALQTFSPDGRQLVVQVKAELWKLLWQTEEQQMVPQHLKKSTQRKREGRERSSKKSAGVSQWFPARGVCTSGHYVDIMWSNWEPMKAGFLAEGSKTARLKLLASLKIMYKLMKWIKVDVVNKKELKRKQAYIIN